MTSDTTDTIEINTTFSQLGLDKNLVKALEAVGYETPTPIQLQTIPLLLEGKDVLGQAQTGTGKTAAFALPLLSNLDLKQKNPQVLVLAPTRELAIQVAEAFQKYAKFLKGFHVLPVYGGQEYGGQIRALNRGVHVVVGTPGRVMDHIRKGTMKLDGLKALVLDEADEMLRMGFIDDVEWVLEQIPEKRQIALFSATMPSQIRRIATKYLTDPQQITIKQKTATASTIRQRYWPVRGVRKLEAITRILEAEDFDAILIFVRTKIATVELAERLEARGYAATVLNGDVAQSQRERTINNLKNGKLDILVATDVAARGLDVERISHVINYDIPHDTESYVHRIGRTGRAGRSGEAILFVAPREKRMLSSIERATNSKIEEMVLPSTKTINENRVSKLKSKIAETVANEDLSFYTSLISEMSTEHDISMEQIAAAFGHLLQGDTPFLMDNKPEQKLSKDWGDDRPAKDRNRGRSKDRDSSPRRQRSGSDGGPPEKGMARYRLAVGHNHKVKPGNIVGAIANEAGLDSKNIGRINIFDDHSLVDLPTGMPPEVLKDLRRVWVSGQQLNISRAGNEDHGRGSGGSERPTRARKPDFDSRDKKPTRVKREREEGFAKRTRASKPENKSETSDDKPKIRERISVKKTDGSSKPSRKKDVKVKVKKPKKDKKSKTQKKKKEVKRATRKKT